MLNLIIDIGNSRTKVALFNQGELMLSFPVDRLTPRDIEQLLFDFQGIEKAILSSVKENQDQLITFLKEHIPFFIELTHNTPLPVNNNYETPETLGKDRIAAAVGANKMFPAHTVLIIDAGTAITYDLIDDSGTYQGGFITPGLQMRFKALNHYTDKLPLLEPVSPIKIDGKNTVNAIRGGIQYGLQGEVENIIRYFSENYGKLTVIFTGGDANYFEKIIKNNNFVALEITLLGLNTILEHSFTHKAAKTF
ncbi:MAG TPA: type III pantothenate kinase [Prolixibacteraceae bacterium]|nr:type III pantothenate kinase [Prolixibacteraceae bacterium]